MPLHKLFSAAFLGLEASLVEVEVDVGTSNAPLIRIVGLPDAAVKESKDRVLHAVKNSGANVETLNAMVHLAPAEVKKVGAFYDLPIALGILSGLGLFKSSFLDHYLIGGELGLAGEIRPIYGALSLSMLAKKSGKKGVVVPKENAAEASLVTGIDIIPIANLKEGMQFFKTGISPAHAIAPLAFEQPKALIDMAVIKGQAHAKRALEIAAAGHHNILMSGPPGTGKTMLAKAFVGILPPLSFEESLDVTNIYSLGGQRSGLFQGRPFRSPHHTISYVGMVGGGAFPKPGEISLAHHGVLFLDELPEFTRSTLEALRQPLEDKTVSICRAGGKIEFPTDIICIAAMNPCPCGYLGHPDKPCKDTAAQIDRYRHKISGPLLDRMDIHLQIPPVPYTEMVSAHLEESSEKIRERVIQARDRLKSKSVPQISSLNSNCKNLLQEAVTAMSISARALGRIVKVAHTISHLQGSSVITEDHIAEALSYRSS